MEKTLPEKKGGKTKIDPEWAPEMKQKHKKSLPNGRQQGGGAFGAAPLGFVLFHLVRICYAFGSFPEPILDRFWFFHILFSGKGFSTFLAPPIATALAHPIARSAAIA